MPETGPVSIAIICEADADRRIGCDLADRVFCAQVEGVTPATLNTHRIWRGLGRGDAYLEVTKIWSIAKRKNIKAHGHFGGQPGEPDARMARKAFLLLVRSDPPPQAVVLVRDSDNYLERRAGWEQAREYRNWPFPVVLGLPHPMRECWVLSGYDPRNAAERKKLAAVQKDLKLDPCVDSHRLAAKSKTEKRHAKNVLKRLVASGSTREAACWQNTDLKILEERGSENGLAAFLAEIRARLVPLFTGKPT